MRTVNWDKLKPPTALLFFILTSVVAILLGFFLLSRETMASWFQAAGYYFIFATFIIWAASLWPEKLTFERSQEFIRGHWPALAVAFILTAAGILNSPPKFRILADETNLMGVALSMYRERSVGNTTEGYYYFESFEPKTTVQGKRPLLFPFLVSVLHTVKGYSASNGFVLNALAGFLTLFLFYFLLQRIFSSGLALLGMLLLASFPVYVIGVSSSGFEIVNLLFALIAFLLLDVYLEKREPRHAELLGLTLVLLSRIFRKKSIVDMLNC